MRTATLRTVGGSTVVVVPPALLEQLGLGPKSKVTILLEGGRLIIEPQRSKRYKLADLLAQCDPKAKRSKDIEDLISAPTVGNECL